MVQWGGADYSMSVGKAGQRGAPEIADAEEKVFKTALEMGVHPRAEINTADDAKRYLDMGVRHFCVGTDIAVLLRVLARSRRGDAAGAGGRIGQLVD